MAKAGEPYYRPDLALVHHLGFGFHADDCAPASSSCWGRSGSATGSSSSSAAGEGC
jgi:hypothetical protein